MCTTKYESVCVIGFLNVKLKKKVKISERIVFVREDVSVYVELYYVSSSGKLYFIVGLVDWRKYVLY